MKIKRIKPFNKTASPIWCATEVHRDKQGKGKQTQTFASTKAELLEKLEGTSENS